jgi:hypothetical protein
MKRGWLLGLMSCAVLSTAGLAQSVAPTEPQTTTAAPTDAAPAGPEPGPAPAQAPNGASNPAAATTVAAPKEAKAGGNAKPPHDPQKQCVDDDDEFKVELKSGRNPVGDTIVADTNFLPTGQPVSVGVRTAYVERTRYFAAVDREGHPPHILFRQDVVTRRAVESDPLVKKHLLDADQTIVTLNLDDDDAGLWQKADLYLYTCGVSSSPARVSKINLRLSPYWYSLWATAAVVLLAYVWVAFALRKKDHTFASFMRSLDPVRVTAGPDGKGSLSKFQILCFSLIVFGLILLYMLQTGMLSDLSGTILALLGINGIGATVAKGADAQRNTIAPENRAWLLRKNWIPIAKTLVDPANASWRDFFSTDGEFDVYRYQSFIFGLVVGLALIAGGVTQLSTFVIPDTILGIVGLSQAVYIGGKLVTPTNISALNAAITDLRDRESKFRDAATAAKKSSVADLQEAISLAGQSAYDAYLDKAKDVAALFTAETGIAVSPDALAPSIG